MGVSFSDMQWLKDQAAALSTAASNFGRFRRACGGFVEHNLRRQLGLQVPSVDPEPAPAELRGIRSRYWCIARYEFTCKLCQKKAVPSSDVICKTAEFGWVHLECSLQAGHGRQKPTRRGGQNQRGGQNHRL